MSATWIDKWLADKVMSAAEFEAMAGPEIAAETSQLAGRLLPPSFAGHLTAEYVTAKVPISLDLLMDEGVIPDTRPRIERKPPTRRERFRSAVSRHRLSVAEWFYRRISGEELPEEGWE